MAQKFLLLCFTLVVFVKIQMNSNAECRAFIVDDLKDYVKAKARPRENELYRYITFLKTSFTQKKTAHLTKNDILILELFMHATSENKQTKTATDAQDRVFYKFKI